MRVVLLAVLLLTGAAVVTPTAVAGPRVDGAAPDVFAERVCITWENGLPWVDPDCDGGWL